MDYHLQKHATFVGKHISALPTPAAILSKPTIEANIAELLRQIDHAGVGFRPHVKTLKVRNAFFYIPLNYL
jgi:D-serine deaminase-like pyridoxal phosphate-dependent protein